MSARFITQKIHEVIAKAYCPPTHEVAFEVRDGAGFNARRSADAIIMGCWPSRGLDLTGVEIKASRGDWLKELREPEKAEAIAQYCDRWVIAAPKGLIKADEVPAGWGWWEIDTERGTLNESKPAPKKEAVSISRHFLAMLLRSHGRPGANEIEEARRRAYEQARERVEQEIQSRVEQRLSSLKQKEARLETINRLVPRDQLWLPDDAFEKAFRFALDARLNGGYGSVTALADELRKTATRIDEALSHQAEGGQG